MTARKKVSARKRIRNAQKRARDAVEEGFADLERRLPSNLRSAVRDMRANLRAFQQQLERARQEREARWRRMQTRCAATWCGCCSGSRRRSRPGAARGARARRARRRGARSASARTPAAIDERGALGRDRPVALELPRAAREALLGGQRRRRAARQFEGVSSRSRASRRPGCRSSGSRLRAARAHSTPGLPAALAVEEPVVSITVGQRDLDRWQRGFQLPFRLSARREGHRSSTPSVAGVALTEFETRLEVVRGWFVLRPRRASILGVPSQLASWLRAYLPIPPISPEARLVGIDHAAGAAHAALRGRGLRGGDHAGPVAAAAPAAAAVDGLIAR